MTNTTGSELTVTFSFSGAAADDFAWTFESGCPSPSDASGKVVPLATNASCTVDMYFYPGALGARNAELTLSDPADAGAVVSLKGNGGIGYYQVSSTGAVAYGGDAGYYGDASNVTLNHPIVGMAQTGDDGGYWLVASDGGIFNYGDAPFYGSTGGIPLNKPIVGMAGTFDANGPNGYWLVASDGGIFSYGDAQFYGSTGSIHLNKPIVGMAATPDGGGYWLVASDGGIFSYGDAQFYGSTGSIHLNKPIVGMVPTPDGGGYWLVASDGGIFSYGDAQFFGSAGALRWPSRLSAWPPCPMAAATGSPPPTVGSSTTATLRSTGAGPGRASARSSAWPPMASRPCRPRSDIPALRPHLARRAEHLRRRRQLARSLRYFAGA